MFHFLLSASFLLDDSLQIVVGVHTIPPVDEKFGGEEQIHLVHIFISLKNTKIFSHLITKSTFFIERYKLTTEIACKTHI